MLVSSFLPKSAVLWVLRLGVDLLEAWRAWGAQAHSSAFPRRV